jgi:putative endonuclease
MQYKLAASRADLSGIKRLFDSCEIPLPIDYHKEVLFGAYDGKRLVGMSSGTPTHHNKKKSLWSKFILVDPDYRRQGIGFGIKQFQRSWALKDGYKTIVWAFNPLDSSQAQFYIHRLGATASAFYLNPESNLDGSTDAGQPSNCIEVVWQLRAQGTQKRLSNALQPAPVVLEVGGKGQPIVRQIASESLCDSSSYRIEIPVDMANPARFQAKLDTEWQSALSEILTEAFLRKYSITNFEMENGRCWYILAAPTPWFLYVLECADHTLYTGITPDIDHRLKLHNAGRGALYTASRTPVRLAATWKFPDRSAAIRAEIAFKRLSRERKLKNINSGLDFGGVRFRKHPT